MKADCYATRLMSRSAQPLLFGKGIVLVLNDSQTPWVLYG